MDESENWLVFLMPPSSEGLQEAGEWFSHSSRCCFQGELDSQHPGDHKGNGFIYHPTRVRCVPPGARPNVGYRAGQDEQGP